MGSMHKTEKCSQRTGTGSKYVALFRHQTLNSKTKYVCASLMYFPVGSNYFEIAIIIQSKKHLQKFFFCLSCSHYHFSLTRLQPYKAMFFKINDHS